MVERIPSILLLACLAIFTALTVWNLRKYLKYKSSPITPLLSVLVLLWLMLLYLNEISYAALVFILTGLIAIIALPHTWKDWVKILRSKGVNPEEKNKTERLLQLEPVYQTGLQIWCEQGGIFVRS